MFIEILKRTPLWVFVLFFVLLTVGYFQSKKRKISRGKVTLFPFAMIALSFYGVLSAFGVASVGLFSWAVGIAGAVCLGLKIIPQRGVTFSTEELLFSIPGSWFPLALMMAIFFTKFTVGVILSRQLPIANEPVFIGAISLLYGFFSGLFLARAFAIWRCAEHTTKFTSNPSLEGVRKTRGSL